MANALGQIQSWINASKLKVQIIPRADNNDRCDSLLGITENSCLGSVVNYVGGFSVANGVIRHFGGSNTLGLSILEVNQIVHLQPSRFKGVLIVADDIYGGLFGISNSEEIANPGNMVYLPPDSYTWENLKIGHSAFLHWSLSGDIALFYSSYKNLPVQSNLPYNKVLSYSPPLWSENVKDGKFTYTIIDSKKSHKIRAEILEQLL